MNISAGPGLKRSLSASVGTATYAPLDRSQFAIGHVALPRGVQLPDSVVEAVNFKVPAEYNFDLEMQVVEQWNRYQNQKFADEEKAAELKRTRDKEKLLREEEERAQNARALQDEKESNEREARRLAEEASFRAAEAVKFAEAEGKRIAARDEKQADPVSSKGAAPPPYSEIIVSPANPFTDSIAESKTAPAPMSQEKIGKLQQMIAVTSAPSDICTRYLEDASWDVNGATNAFWDAN